MRLSHSQRKKSVKMYRFHTFCLPPLGFFFWAHTAVSTLFSESEITALSLLCSIEDHGNVLLVFLLLLLAAATKPTAPLPVNSRRGKTTNSSTSHLRLNNGNFSLRKMRSLPAPATLVPLPAIGQLLIFHFMVCF